jgi:F-type H+-transporting ATPase subunit epsilon
MKAFHLTVSSPDGNKFDGDVVKFDVRGVEGELAIMAGHTPFVTSVMSAPCAVWLDENTKKNAVCDGGLLTVGIHGTTFISGSFEFTE